MPDQGYRRDRKPLTWVPTAAIVAEIVSPDDESWAKLGFYAAHEVDEVLVVDPVAQRLTWLTRDGSGYTEVDGSSLLGLTTAELTSRIDWPPVS